MTKNGSFVGRLFLVLMLVSATSAFAAKVELPGTLEEFGKLTTEQMKKLPDVKWPLHKAVSETALAGKSETEVTLLRNSIYAQVGFHFTAVSLDRYFHTRTWYKDTGYKPTQLTPVDKKNLEIIQAFADKSFHGMVAQTGISRSIASAESDNALARKFVKLGYCIMDYGTDGNGMFMFGRNFKLSFKLMPAGNEGDSYDPYDPPYSNAYDSDEESAANIPSDIKTGTWRVSDGKVLYKLSHGWRQLKFNNETWTKHTCSRVGNN
jgi:hypothetical protein